MLKAAELRKSFADIIAVDGVSFDVQRGEIFGLLGPNGAGKSTTIRVILNILRPDSGYVSYDGRPFDHSTRNLIGYLPEERGLYKKATVLNTLQYLGQLRGMSNGQVRVESRQWLQRFHLLPMAHKRVEELSKGNQQKVQLIAALLHNPPLVILDEPFSGLDPVNQIAFKDVLLELKGLGRAVVFSTHQMEQAERLSDTLCLINKGAVVLKGSVREVKRLHGKGAIHVEFNGDSQLLKEIPGVESVLLFQNAAELRVTPASSPQAILNWIIQRVEVRKFEVLEPSLHSIFLQTVGSSSITGLAGGRAET